MSPVTSVSVHPTALLSVVDHYNRVAKGTSKRVIGTLLGETKSDGLHVTSSFAVPFEEDAKDPRIWFVDHDYHETMFDMFKKVNPRERIVGWYSTGPKIRPCDSEMHEVFRRYCVDATPAFVIIDVTSKEDALPIKSYVTGEDKTFFHIPSFVSSLEAEEVGVEHLLRDIKNATASTLSVRVSEKTKALRTLAGELNNIAAYLADVLGGKLPHNQQILGNLQTVVNALSSQRLLKDEELAKAFNIERNDETLSIYIGAALRSTLALHNLIDNKLKNKGLEVAEEEKKGPVGVTVVNTDDKVEASGA
jgi:26S proteasome regulatory subunit N8